ncbi:MAG: pirin family protein [Burkholderiales bacterium]
MTSPILEAAALGVQWRTRDPFLFCVYHFDRYPSANEKFGPAAPLTGRDIGQDFSGIDGWRMYHGQVVPGFPQHPHRGFETVTIVRHGYIDHSDSLGAAARFGEGDVQWLTAGEGIVHSEMFPLFDRAAPNPVELFQIWLNLPAKDKFAPPHFKMLWANEIPVRTFTDDRGGTTKVTLFAGTLDDAKPLAPPPNSWAAQDDHDVAIWTISLGPGARWAMPSARGGAKTTRSLYFFAGKSVRIADKRFDQHAELLVDASRAIELESLDGPCEVALLQGRPIAEPVSQHGPFVMNTRAELQTAFNDYQRTQFGGWPWPVDDPVHGAAKAGEVERFARYPDGRVVRAGG